MDRCRCLRISLANSAVTDLSANKASEKPFGAFDLRIWRNGPERKTKIMCFRVSRSRQKSDATR